MNQGYARVNWKAFRELALPERKTSWTWSKPRGERSTVKFIPNPSSKVRYARVKLNGRKVFRVPKVKVVLVATDRDTAKTGEPKSCTVNGLAIAAQTPWVIASNALRRAGRSPGKPFNVASAISAGKVKGFKFTKVTRGKTSLGKFLENHPIGRFYVLSTTHAFAVVHGKVLDWSKTMGANRIVEAAYKVKPDNREGE
jgi:hypothetical protein